MVGGLRTASGRRRLAGAALLLAVLALHLAGAERLARHAAGFVHAQHAMPARIQVAYVREMALVAPPRVAPPRLAPARALRRPVPVVAPEPEAAPEVVIEAPVAEAAPLADAAASAVDVADVQPLDAAASAATGPSFEWPGSTRLRYRLTGNYRGEVHGQAQVEWIRVGSHYQVHLDVVVGLSFAPLFARRMSSDGEITPAGLAPRRYDQETKLAFNDAYRAVVQFEGDSVRLANGQVLVGTPGVQDTASQFVQMSWLFATQPERLRVGNTVEILLAMPRNLSLWVYDVADEETLYMPFGELQAFHLQPRRVARAGGDLTTEVWIAPALRYLPVRFRIHQDAETYLDLVLDRRPELAAP